MKSHKKIFLFSCMLLSLQILFAQDKLDIKFGKIKPADFDLSGYTFDSGANAVIIADIGTTSFEGNTKSGMTMVFTRFMRVKILNKNGFDIAENQIQLYNDGKGNLQRVTELKGSTFNLENGVVVETKLDEKAVFTEKYSKEIDLEKFTLPALREGSVYDISYTIKSDFFDYLRSWSFQGDYPELWSEYTVTIPPVFSYVIRMQGDDRFDVNTSKELFQHFTIVQNNGSNADNFFTLSGNSIQHRWVKKNVPPLKEEAYTTTLKNYLSKVSFQLHYIQWTKDSERHDYLSTWFMASEKMMNDEDFGLKLNHDNGWMTKDVQTNIAGCSSDEDRIKKIYAFIRDNFTCTGYNSIWAESSLKDVYKRKGGNVAEINLLLTAMLRQAHIDADPVVLSTRDHGTAIQNYPLMQNFNYVICIAHSGDQSVLLDASRPYSGFGQLVADCYNGGARIINKEKPYIVDLSPDSILESSLTSVFIINDGKGHASGGLKTELGKQASYNLRQEVKQGSQKDYFKRIQTAYGPDVTLENPGIDSLDNFERPAIIHYDFSLKNLLSADVIYFNPMMAENYKRNPFKSIERHYPVEMPYKSKETYVLTMDIPKGYQVDELPKSARVALNGTDGLFEYLIQQNAARIQMRVTLKLNKAFFPTEDYATLRDFFGYVVKKENEQIVFKKIP